jgi:hypothetical protein
MLTWYFADDISSTLWTIIEENIGIICACLPMFRMPLSFIFPSLFSTPKATVNYSYGSGPRSQNQHNTWQQIPGPTKSTGVNHSIARHNDDESEEYILNAVQGQTVKDDVDDADVRKIRKTTQYQVTYESGGERKV